MKYYLITIFILLAGCTWYFWPQKPQDTQDIAEKCQTQRCLDDEEFIKTAYQKQWEEYEKEINKETIEENEYGRCIKKGFTMTCQAKDKQITTNMLPMINGTTSIPLSPKTKLTLRSWGGFNNECKTFLCPRTSYDDRVANMRRYFEE